MIGYYIHHQGYGHLARATSIAARSAQPITALSSLRIPTPHPFARVISLPRDDQSVDVRETDAHGAFHWAPHHDDGFGRRMQEIARWVADVRPNAFVTDVSVEVATFVRLLGIPVIVIALPGKRFDSPHQLVHRLADHIIAAWPRELSVPSWLRPYEDKTSYVGGISRFDGRARPAPVASTRTRVLVLAGAGEAFGVTGNDHACPGTEWSAIGGPDGTWVEDPWPRICSADVVVTHAGQGAIADIAAAQRRAVVIAAARPFDEQAVTADVLRRHRLATVARVAPDTRAWPALIAHAMATDPGKWSRWRVAGAADRAADVIDTVARRNAKVGVA